MKIKRKDPKIIVKYTHVKCGTVFSQITDDSDFYIKGKDTYTSLITGKSFNVYDQSNYNVIIYPEAYLNLQEDAQEEAHWEISFDGWYPYCTKCGKEPQGREMTDYCPNCGVKMNRTIR